MLSYRLVGLALLSHHCKARVPIQQFEVHPSQRDLDELLPRAVFFFALNIDAYGLYSYVLPSFYY